MTWRRQCQSQGSTTSWVPTKPWWNPALTTWVSHIGTMINLCVRTALKFTFSTPSPVIQAIVDGLILKNHLIEHLTSSGAVIQAVVRYAQGLHAQSDPRKSGYASGYWGQKALLRSHSEGVAVTTFPAETPADRLEANGEPVLEAEWILTCGRRRRHLAFHLLLITALERRCTCFKWMLDFFILSYPETTLALFCQPSF